MPPRTEKAIKEEMESIADEILIAERERRQVLEDRSAYFERSDGYLHDILSRPCMLEATPVASQDELSAKCDLQRLFENRRDYVERSDGSLQEAIWRRCLLGKRANALKLELQERTDSYSVPQNP